MLTLERCDEKCIIEFMYFARVRKRKVDAILNVNVRR